MAPNPCALSFPTAALPTPKTLGGGAHSYKRRRTAQGGAGDKAEGATSHEEGCVCPFESERNPLSQSGRSSESSPGSFLSLSHSALTECPLCPLAQV